VKDSVITLARQKVLRIKEEYDKRKKGGYRGKEQGRLKRRKGKGRNRN